MNITAGMVKDLREMTGAGMMDCKKALAECDGNMDEAIEFLRKKGLAAAEKKASRIAAEGICDTCISEDGKVAAIVEVNSETDFVAKNDTFKAYVADVCAQAAASDAADIDAFLAETWAKDSSKTVNEALAAQIAIIGENMKIRRFEKVVAADGFVESYIHGGGKIGILVEFKSNVYTAAVRECAKNVAMQIAAMSPKYVRQSEISEEYIAKEKEILKEQAMNDPANANKPEAIIDKMLVGRLNKQMKEICLVDQAYVKDGDMTVGKYIESVAKAEGCELDIVKFVRFATGEGLEKKNENFAEEVAKQMGM